MIHTGKFKFVFRHNQLSDLHKQNLEAARKQSQANSFQYRDRAKERREKYGEEEDIRPNRLKERYLKALDEVGPVCRNAQKTCTIVSSHVGSVWLKYSFEAAACVII